MTEKSINHAAFQELLNDRKLMAVKCRNCEAVFLPPRPLCTECHSDQLDWIEAAQEGELAAFTIIHIAPTAMLDAGYGRDNPYCAGIVKLSDGQLISAQIVDADVENPENIQIGTKLSLNLIERGEGDEVKTYLAFRPTVEG